VPCDDVIVVVVPRCSLCENSPLQ